MDETHQDTGNDKRHVATLGVTQLKEFVVTANGSGVVHAADGNGQKDGTECSLPEDADPFFLEVEEQHDGDDTVSDSNDGGGSNEPDFVVKSVIGSAYVAAVVHADNTRSSQYTGQKVEEAAHEDALYAKFGDVKGDTQTGNGQDAGEECVA